MAYCSPEKKNKQSRKYKILFCLIMILLLIILVGLIYLLRLDFWQIKEIKVSNNKLVIAEEIIPLAQKKMRGSCWPLIPCTNKLFFSTEELKVDILNNFLVIKDVWVVIAGNVLQIKIEEREPQDLWCQEKDDNFDCFFLDQTGLIFAESPYFSTGYLIWTGTSRLSISEKLLGQQILDQDKFTELRNWVSRFVNEFGRIKTLHITDNLELVLELVNGLKIIIYYDDNLDNVWKTVKLLSDNNYLNNQNLAYIDLSYIANNQVFYCNQDEICQNNF